MSTIVTIDPSSHTYTISPPSSTTSSSRSSSPIASFYQTSSTTTSATSSSDSLDTVKSTTSTSTIKLLPPASSSSADSITIPISRTPTPSSASTPQVSQQQHQHQHQHQQPKTKPKPKPKPAQPKFKLPNYYVPPSKLVHPSIAVTSSSSPPPPPPPPPAQSNALQSAASSTTIAKPPLLRKKSGELIKSSLKLPALLQRSISSPHISADGQVDGIVSPRKSVRFASRLINVRMFDGCDTPASVSSAGSPLDSPDEGEEEDYFYTTGANKSGSRATCDGFDLSVPAFEDFEFSKFTNKTANFDWNFNFAKPKDEIKEYRLMSHNIPSTTTPNTTNSTLSKIWMTSAYLLKVNNKTYLCGWLNVVNMAFAKEINLKLTIDNWASSIIVAGITKYQKSINSSLDQFKFMLDLESFNIVDEKTIELCLEYNTNGQTYWGNNVNQNYKFDIERKKNKTQAKVTAPPSTSQYQAASKPKSSASGSKQSINSSGYEEICTKLLNHKSSLALNFTNDEFSFRPSLKKSYSASDVTTTSGGAAGATSYGAPRYSNRQRQKDNSSSKQNGGSGIEDMTYADILQKYCFAGTPSSPSPAVTGNASTTATSTSAVGSTTSGLTVSAPASAHSSPLMGSSSSSSSCPSSPQPVVVSAPAATIAAPTQTSIFI
ncbi:unnamed protein product [Candida parapsilosis]